MSELNGFDEGGEIVGVVEVFLFWGDVKVFQDGLSDFSSVDFLSQKNLIVQIGHLYEILLKLLIG